MYGTHTVITITPDQLAEIVRKEIRSELASYTPPLPEGSGLPELLTRKQVAKELQVSLVTLNDWAKDNEERAAILVPFKINSKVFYHRKDVLAALKESRRFKADK